ncbi:putative DNA-formamidopyrimidine glycosylase, DNA-(apurinic or apyrimidinic site) lyase [Medicago truncatula]|uniref:Formamidopyrimidine-DNA glycosylase n=1 Tax=Medicago truncatula TaxID=3880 RepID=G7II90_MEDTR|nr:formamidopyrimidine-DNA glycosylase isoform X1 [Medicago truncatula]AES68177.2 formamidopyrimidine-DNA glycosylase [Medicago truncatula]RHN76542.1 putative DNA-formamidopyrimidine glycosylase, DNA-(apurinic or apyrimidinic site) lyase [Medicago truncatula]
MPELPEVEAARRAVEENCIGKKITKCIVADDNKVIDGVSREEFEASVVGKKIVAARRKGKNMWLQLDSPPFPSFQFGMAGAVYIKGVAVTKYKRSAVNDEDEWPSKYSKFFIQLDDGLELSFTDKRRFARVRLLKDPTSVPPISELGPDALFDFMTLDEFTERLHKKKTEIKALLLDQSYISGIGNWVADEVLYQARIHPRQIASSLSGESCSTLYKCIKEVVEKAVEVGADSSQYPTNWIFHSREKKPGKAFVDGKTIEFITAGGRTTAYVPELQKLSGSQVLKETGKLRGKASKKSSVDDDNNDGADENLESLKSKKGTKAGAKAKKPSKRKKTEESDDDNDGDAGTDNYDDSDQVEKKKPGSGTNRKQAKGEKQSKKSVQGNQSSRSTRSKAK